MTYVEDKTIFPWTETAAFTRWEVPTDVESWQDPLRRFQDGRCAMCGSTRPLVTDHDHETGMIRGLLCRSCNASEPHADHEAWRLWRAGTTPMAKLGLEEEYDPPVPTFQREVSDDALSRAVLNLGATPHALAS